ncbi:hypothetical protein B0T14DRAFT_569536 [Immersiella caudata]|uniref:Heterokaryon incompatibility domain-containing protein n=1 Tax=Immersiella caudata TaxID=314043 RepID=A0AA39WDQ9_9PEZI|nr:hypothetical protein B0T14DRAFT_569536 [Immersiella caudata]
MKPDTLAIEDQNSGTAGTKTATQDVETSEVKEDEPVNSARNPKLTDDATPNDSRFPNKHLVRTKPTQAPHDKKFTPFWPYLDRPSAADDDMLIRFDELHMDEQWIDLNVLRSWLTHCDRHHGGICRFNEDANNLSRPVKGPDWLIAVENFRIVRAFPKMAYYALSYTYSKGAIGQTIPSPEAAADTDSETDLSQSHDNGPCFIEGITRREVLRDQVASLIRSSVWYSRGWTFQEEMFARRGALQRRRPF